MMTEYLFLGQLSFTTVCFCCELSEEVIVFFTHTTCLSFCVRNSKREITQMFVFFHCIPLHPFLSFSLLVPGESCNWLKYWSVKEEIYSEKV